MAFDAFFLSAVLEEVKERCIGARIDKIHQPSRDTLLLHLRCREGREKLLFEKESTGLSFSGHSSMNRLRCLSKKQPKNVWDGWMRWWIIM